MNTANTKSELTRNILAIRAMDAALWYLPQIRAAKEPQHIFWLYGGLSTFYARPFKNSNGFNRLNNEDVISSELLDCHNKLILYRDQVVAHSDSNHESIGTQINRAYVRVNKYMVLIEDRYPYPSESGLVCIENMINHVRNTLNQATLPALQMANHALFPNGAKQGLYRLTIDDAASDWLEPIPDDGFDF